MENIKAIIITTLFVGIIIGIGLSRLYIEIINFIKELKKKW